MCMAALRTHRAPFVIRFLYVDDKQSTYSSRFIIKINIIDKCN